jgi:putative transcriptional regulator
MKQKDFDRLVTSIKQAGAMMIGVSVATLQNWEQGRRRPEGPARALLRVAARNPRAVVAALAS